MVGGSLVQLFISSLGEKFMIHNPVMSNSHFDCQLPTNYSALMLFTGFASAAFIAL